MTIFCYCIDSEIFSKIYTHIEYNGLAILLINFLYTILH